jgi:hypothetical protein
MASGAPEIPRLLAFNQVTAKTTFPEKRQEADIRGFLRFRHGF